MGYEFRKSALYHPESCPVFADNQVPHFDPDTQSFSLNDAWWLSNFSHLAYFEDKAIEHHLHRVGFELSDIFSKNGSFAFIAISGASAVLSFRGTAIHERENIMNDIDLSLVPISDNISVHKGFLRSLDQIWPEIEVALNQLKKRKINIWYTGHSLGAAMATIATSRLKATATYGFGSPRVGNKSFCESVKNQNIYNMVNCCDAVTILPPEILGYKEAGETVFITSKSRLIFSPSNKQIIRERTLGYIQFYRNLYWFHSDSVYLRSLADHIIVNYSSAILENIRT